MCIHSESHSFKSFVTYLRDWVIRNLDQINAENRGSIELELKFGHVRRNEDGPVDTSSFTVYTGARSRMIPAIDKKSYEKIVEQFGGSVETKFEVRDISERTNLPNPKGKGRIRVNLRNGTLIESISKERISDLLVKFPHSNHDCKLSLNIEHQIPALAYLGFSDKYSREKKGHQFVVRGKNRLDVAKVMTKVNGKKKYVTSNYELELEMSVAKLLKCYDDKDNDGIEKVISHFVQDGLRIKNILKQVK